MHRSSSGGAPTRAGSWLAGQKQVARHHQGVQLARDPSSRPGRVLRMVPHLLVAQLRQPVAQSGPKPGRQTLAVTAPGAKPEVFLDPTPAPTHLCSSLFIAFGGGAKSPASTGATSFVAMLATARRRGPSQLRSQCDVTHAFSQASFVLTIPPRGSSRNGSDLRPDSFSDSPPAASDDGGGGGCCGMFGRKSKPQAPASPPSRQASTARRKSFDTDEDDEEEEDDDEVTYKRAKAASKRRNGSDDDEDDDDGDEDTGRTAQATAPAPGLAGKRTGSGPRYVVRASPPFWQRRSAAVSDTVSTWFAEASPAWWLMASAASWWCVLTGDRDLKQHGSSPRVGASACVTSVKSTYEWRTCVRVLKRLFTHAPTARTGHHRRLGVRHQKAGPRSHQVREAHQRRPGGRAHGQRGCDAGV